MKYKMLLSKNNLHIIKIFINSLYYLILYVSLGSLFSNFVNFLTPEIDKNKNGGILFLEIIYELSLTAVSIYYITRTVKKFWKPFKLKKDIENVIEDIDKNFLMITVLLFQQDLINKIVYLMNGQEFYPGTIVPP